MGKKRSWRRQRTQYAPFNTQAVKEDKEHKVDEIVLGDRKESPLTEIEEETQKLENKCFHTWTTRPER